MRVWESTLQATETETQTPTQAQNLQTTFCPAIKYARTLSQRGCRQNAGVVKTTAN